MEQFIGCDAHKKFSVFVVVNEKGHASEAIRVGHDREAYREFLSRLPSHSLIAVEASGHYSWLVDEMEGPGHYPKLCNPLEAKRRMGSARKLTSWMPRGWLSCFAMVRCRKFGFRRANSEINANCCVRGFFWYTYALE